MRAALWPEMTADDNDREAPSLLADPDNWAIFVAEIRGALVGFVEAHLREYADGCETSPVGFVEGWWVEPEARGAGVGRALLAAAERWAKDRGCTEMGSDALIDNLMSQRAHFALGYEEVERRVCFRKALV